MDWNSVTRGEEEESMFCAAVAVGVAPTLRTRFPGEVGGRAEHAASSPRSSSIRPVAASSWELPA